MKLFPLPAFQPPAGLQHHGLQLEAILVTHQDAGPIGDLFHYAAQSGAAKAFDARTTTDKVNAYAANRQWKNEFR